MKAIETKYLPPTNYRGSRIVAKAEGGHRVTIPYPHEHSGMDCHAQAALALCRKLGWTGTLIGGGLENTYVFVFSPNGDDSYSVYPITKEQ